MGKTDFHGKYYFKYSIEPKQSLYIANYPPFKYSKLKKIFQDLSIKTNAKEVIGIDIDEQAIKIAQNYAEKNKEDVEFITKDVKDVDTKCYTVIMNPPFGAQKSNRWADRGFIEKGFEISKVIYSLHLTKTIPFIEKLVSSLNGEIDFKKNYLFLLLCIRFPHQPKKDA